MFIIQESTPTARMPWLKVKLQAVSIYTIKPDHQSAFQAYCDMDTDGVHKYLDISTSIFRNWNNWGQAGKQLLHMDILESFVSVVVMLVAVDWSMRMDIPSGLLALEVSIPSGLLALEVSISSILMRIYE